MTRHSATILSIDTADPRIPEGLAAPAHDVGEVVVLLADREAHQDGWPGQAAVAIAREWSASGRRVILADADLAGAGLHERVGAVNGEGVSDMVLYGASPRRVSWKPPGSSFLFVSAGTVVSDPSRLYAHPRWSRLLGAFRESGSVLILYALGDDEEVRALMADGDRVYRLTAHRPDLEPEPEVIGVAEEGVGLIEESVVFVEENVWAADATPAEVEASPPPGAEEIPDDVLLPRWVLPDPKKESPEVVARAVAAPVEDEPDWNDDGQEGPPPAPSLGRETVAASEWLQEDKAPFTDTPGFASKHSALEWQGRATSRRVTPLLIALLFLVLAGALLGAWLGYFSIPGVGSTPGVTGSILPLPLFDPDGWG